MKFLKIKTFKIKLIFCNIILILFIASIASIYNFTSYYKNTLNREIENSYFRILSINENIYNGFSSINNISYHIIQRKSFSNLLKNTAPSNQSLLSSNKLLKDYCAISGYNSYIQKIFINISDNINIQTGYISGNINDANTIQSQDWFLSLLNNNEEMNFIKIFPSPFSYTEENIIPIVKYLNPLDTSSWIFTAISSKLIEDNINTSPTNSIICATDLNGNLIYGINNQNYNSEDLVEIAKTLISSDKTTGTINMQIGKFKSYITYCINKNIGLITFEIIPINLILNNTSNILNTIFMIFLWCLLLGIVLSVLISKKLNQPIQFLVDKVNLIAKGNFIKDPKIEGFDEIGQIGIQINEMSGKIQTLLNNKIDIEREKKDLEIKMLQAQINPHFLYNTLDSIKWIAIMQKNSGIVNMVTSLSTLLKNMAKQVNEKITLQQELDFLNDYITIEKIRYMDLFDVVINVTDKKLLNAKIIKLTLQPLVENAIFSGIEPTGNTGIININVFTKDNRLFIEVLDNGIGINKDDIPNLLTKKKAKSNHMSGIGLSNVYDRIKLVYGDTYGLKIESEFNKYTKITIVLPLEF